MCLFGVCARLCRPFARDAIFDSFLLFMLLLPLLLLSLISQVEVLGLPWEYTAADVRALIQASVEAEAPAMDNCVQAVEVAYREDGKSEVRRGWVGAGWGAGRYKEQGGGKEPGCAGGHASCQPGMELCNYRWQFWETGDDNVGAV